MKNFNEIIIFDGNCILCSSFYKWLLRNDKKNCFLFTNTQSEFYSKNSNIDKSKDAGSITPSGAHLSPKNISKTENDSSGHAS